MHDLAASPAGAPAGRSAPADASSLPGGLRINEYVIERTLGGGGFGTTYLARDTNLDLTVALKEYLPRDLAVRGPAHAVQVRQGNEDEQAAFDWGLERFLDEARALAAFRHPNIVRVLRYFKANGTAYIVMEYESGLPLKRWVPHSAPLSLRGLLSIVYPLLDGLEAVHTQGFLHRDIKPDNIYVRADGTPVLLDFGAARRVSAQRDVTNIVSPGFAPFEQYHAQGHQGPWTDLYALGAVLYWMTTGKKPVDAAARVKNDPMLPASSLAEVGVYGSKLLRAIEWAMHPDEARRPQHVEQFRAALRDAEQHQPTAIGSAPAGPGHAPAAHAPAGFEGSSRPTVRAAAAERRNLLGTVMCLELVGSPARSPEHRAALRKLFDDMLAKSLKGVAQDSRIAVDTGEGTAICFLGDPEEALRSALLLRDLLGQRYGTLVSARIGLHMGPVRVVGGLHPGAGVGVVGDGIHVAQRIMDFAQGGQVLVSRACHDVISRITDDAATLLQYLGQREDKHGRRHEVYAADPGRGRNGHTRPQGPSTGYTHTLPVRSFRPLDAALVDAIESELARHIGPLARVLVRKAQPLAQSPQDLREALAPSIQEARARDSFLASPGQPHGVTRPRSGSTSGRTDSGRRSAAQHDAEPAGAARSGPAAWPPSPSGRQSDATAEELAVIEHHLSRHIGPMARVLLRREVGRCGSFDQLVEAVAENIEPSEQRSAFLQVLKQALPRRQY